MNKEETRQKLRDAGDAIVTYRGEVSGKLKYTVVTLDFKTEYVASKRTHAEETDKTILAWAWDTDSYKLLRIDLITNIVPLASILKNNVR